MPSWLLRLLLKFKFANDSSIAEPIYALQSLITHSDLVDLTQFSCLQQLVPLMRFIYINLQTCCLFLMSSYVSQIITIYNGVELVYELAWAQQSMMSRCHSLPMHVHNPLKTWSFIHQVNTLKDVTEWRMVVTTWGDTTDRVAQKVSDCLP